MNCIASTIANINTPDSLWQAGSPNSGAGGLEMLRKWAGSVFTVVGVITFIIPWSSSRALLSSPNNTPENGSSTSPQEVAA